MVLDNTAPVPTIDPATGRFSGPMPPANDFEFGLAEFVQTLLAAPGSFSLTLDSIGLGSAYDGIPNNYYFTGASGATVTQVTLPITQDPTNLDGSNFTYFTAISPDAALAERFGGSDQFKLTARIQMNLRGNYYTNSWGRGCANAASGLRCQRVTRRERLRVQRSAVVRRPLAGDATRPWTIPRPPTRSNLTGNIMVRPGTTTTPARLPAQRPFTSRTPTRRSRTPIVRSKAAWAASAGGRLQRLLGCRLA